MFKRILVAIGDPDQADPLRAASAQLALLDPCCEVEEFHIDTVRDGDILDRLLHRALETRADLLVMGSKRHIRASRAAMLAPCSVLMVPDNHQLDLNKVLVPVDFSEASGVALEFAAELSAKAKGRCQAIAVECDDDDWLEWPEEPGKMRARLNQFLAKHAGERRCQDGIIEPLNRSTTALISPGLSFAHGIEGANISFTIVSAAQREGATLLVMGTRGRSRSASILLGSVTEKAIQLSPIPLLAFKPAGDPLGLLEGILARIRADQPAVLVN